MKGKSVAARRAIFGSMYEKKANSLDGIGAATAKPEQQWQQPALGTVAARKAIFGSMINGMAPIRPNKSESHRKLPPHIPVTLSTVKKNWAKASSASFIAGTMTANEVRARLKEVKTELGEAADELERRKLELRQSEEALALASGWVEVTDDQYGTYYYNEATGVTSWVRPVEGLAPLPEGWAEVRDESGHIYYYHADTGTSTWDRPSAEAPSSPPALAAMDVPAEQGAEEEAVPMWKAIGVPEARASSAAGAFLLEELEDAVAEGDFEKAIELRGQVRLTMGRSNSVHQMNAEL